MNRIWMNHWFSTALNIIDLLRQDNRDAYIIGSNENEYSVIKNGCDEWYQEPVLKDDEYVEFCLDFCKEHDVDFFLPRRGMIKISEQKSRFEEIGVKVMMDDYSIVSTLNHKEKAYEYFKENYIGTVPDFYIVKTVDEFKKSYEILLGKYKQVCFKFEKDEGGKSFRLIDNNRKGYAALFKKQNTRMTLNDVLDALSEREVFSPIMIMPFLPDDEISVDCLNTSNGLIALPRIKGNAKYELLRFDKNIIDICRDFQDKAGLECPYNIQFKYLDGIPYFLEVNTRMSGGVHMSCYASGVNIPLIALKKLAGEDIRWSCNNEEKILAQVLQPVVIE